MSTIHYRTQGEGNTILLLHGFPFNSSIWNSFTPYLADHFRVITIDLPGFGESALPSGVFTIQDVAQQVNTFLEEQQEHEVVVIGHSLGGYVALAMVAQQPDRFAGLGLFHSTAYADTEEKRASRSKVIEFVETNGVEAFTSNFVTPLFADKTHASIQKVREINMKASREAVIGYTKAMRDRPDQTNVLKRYARPVLFIAGEKDPGIPPAAVREQSLLTGKPFLSILPDQAHMGLVEQPGVTASIVIDFARHCF